MDEHHETKLQQLREQVARGEYRVEPTLVADALIRRVQGLQAAAEPVASRPAAGHGRRRLRAAPRVAGRLPDALAEPLAAFAG
jgi:hypothetical protein